MINNEEIIDIQRQIFEQTGARTDAHYKEGYGVLFVHEGAPLTPFNVIATMEDQPAPKPDLYRDYPHIRRRRF